jgi:hypothetical protein
VNFIEAIIYRLISWPSSNIGTFVTRGVGGGHVRMGHTEINTKFQL